MSDLLRCNLGLTLRELRRAPAFAGLPPLPWQVFIAIALHWQVQDEAWPSQDTLGRLSGYAVRTVRRGVAELAQRALVGLRRLRTGDGSERIFYAPGPVTVRELSGIDARYPADPRSRGHRIEDPGNSSRTRTSVVVVAPELGDDDLAIARIALAEHFQRRYPERPAPCLFDERDLQSVARCAAATRGDRETKLRTLRDAIDGAFRTSARAPTVRFVWEKLEHFFEHAERGRRARAQVVASVRPAPEPGVPIPAAQIEADLVKLFGPSWRTKR